MAQARFQATNLNEETLINEKWPLWPSITNLVWSNLVWSSWQTEILRRAADADADVDVEPRDDVLSLAWVNKEVESSWAELIYQIIWQISLKAYWSARRTELNETIPKKRSFMEILASFWKRRVSSIIASNVVVDDVVDDDDVEGHDNAVSRQNPPSMNWPKYPSTIVLADVAPLWSRL